MKRKTIEKILAGKFKAFAASIADESVRALVEKNSIITGGAIASMLLQEEVNDFDVYFTDKETVLAVANYYVGQIKKEHPNVTVKEEDDGRVRILVPSSGKVDSKEGEGSYRPVFLSSNAISLSGSVQLVLRFYGDPEEIHSNYDFAHCTNYWESRNDTLTLRLEALESLLCKELRYRGSKYPVCSVIRIRKFIGRGWTINAGQVLKMLMQVSELDLNDPAVLEDQLVGVDSAYFEEVISQMKRTGDRVDSSYVAEIIEKVFG